MESLANEIDLSTRIVDKNLTNLAELTNRAPAEVTIIPIDEQAALVVRLKDLKRLFEEALKLVNKALVPCEMNLCRSIADTPDGLTYRHDLATLTASAKGFFEIKEPKLFFDWLHHNFYQDSEDGFYNAKETVLDIFIRLANSKREREKFCTKLLEDGQKLPPGIKEHIIATVTVRRKRNGKEEEK